MMLTLCLSSKTHNMESVFGCGTNSRWQWFLPVHSKLRGNGIVWKTKPSPYAVRGDEEEDATLINKSTTNLNEEGGFSDLCGMTGNVVFDKVLVQTSNFLN